MHSEALGEAREAGADVAEEQVVLAVSVERAVRRLLFVTGGREEARARPARAVAVRALPTRAAPPAASRAGAATCGVAAGGLKRRSARRPGPSPRGAAPGAPGRSASARRRLRSRPLFSLLLLSLLSGAAARLAEVDKERPAACARVEVDERVDGAGVGVDSRQPAPRLPKDVTGLNNRGARSLSQVEQRRRGLHPLLATPSALCALSASVLSSVLRARPGVDSALCVLIRVCALGFRRWGSNR